VKKKAQTCLFPIVLSLLCAGCAVSAPEPYGPVPSEAQLAWQRMEINMFCHFGPNTFTGAEWGSGEEAETTFNPSALDCRQWVDVARQAGMGGIILTAKHHDGFCLWPSAFSNHTVTPENDVLRPFVDACREGGIKAGVYISPWDRNHPSYGTEEYNSVFANTLKEVHTNYGPFFEQWFDGACGEGPNGKKQEYDWPLFEGTVLEINPHCVLFSDVGPGCRWVGNEEGHAGETNWSTLLTEVGSRKSEFGGCGTAPLSPFTSPLSPLQWIPAEVDVSIRPGWFWHKDEHPKSVDELMEIYYNSVGRNGLLLLNVPPDSRGRIPSEDSAVLVAFRAERDRIFSHDLAQDATIYAFVDERNVDSRYPTGNLTDSSYHTFWMPGDNDTSYVTLVVQLPEEREIDIVVLQEYIPLGQRVSRFSIGYKNHEHEGVAIAQGTTIGYKRILRIPSPIRTKTLFVTLEQALAPPILNRLSLHCSK
jgi:alpha-L-fucosidase